LDILHQFGNPAGFAIRYSPCGEEYQYLESDQMAVCHLVLNNIIIGNPKDECHLPTWFRYITKARDFIRSNQYNLYRPEFNGLSEREIYESIIKSNQQEKGFNKHYLYLQQLDYSVWLRHVLRLDETNDSYLICFYVKNNEIRFIADRWWLNEGRRNKNSMIFKTLPLDYFLEVLENTIEFLIFCYPYLRENKLKPNYNTY
jgi:hypothetical protein